MLVTAGFKSCSSSVSAVTSACRESRQVINCKLLSYVKPNCLRILALRPKFFGPQLKSFRTTHVTLCGKRFIRRVIVKVFIVGWLDCMHFCKPSLCIFFVSRFKSLNLKRVLLQYCYLLHFLLFIIFYVCWFVESCIVYDVWHISVFHFCDDFN